MNSNSLPLYEKIKLKRRVERCLESIILILLLSLLTYRLRFVDNHGLPWLLAFICELCFTFNWLLSLNMKWNPVDYRTFPQNLSQRVQELPPVDIVVTTADPVLEPPIITVNTVISLLALDYPSHKLACYVSDDGCSPLTFYSLVQASEFAKIWVPFCKKYDIQVRAPFRYFSTESQLQIPSSSDFRLEERRMKVEYEHLCRKIEDATQKSVSDLLDDYAVFLGTESKNHQTVIKLIWVNKECDSNGIPHLIYVAREKRPNHPHHYKAGAMNALTRVSGVMTSAPFILNVDCDMFVNNPKIVLHAMCLLVGVKREEECVFVQFPQMFYNGLKDDPFGNEMVILFETMLRGMSGIQGSLYGGTGCFHRRRIIYGLLLDEAEVEAKRCDETLVETFGHSVEFNKSAAQILAGLHEKRDSPQNLSSSIEAAQHVANCAYENDTAWGKKVGWMYGSATEDVLTGMKIHSKGWKSALIMPYPPGFLGCAPSGGSILLTQRKRWVTGLLEISFSKNCPVIVYLTTKLQFRQCLAYMFFLTWSLTCIPELLYNTLPAYCIISNSHFLPKVQEAGILIIVAIFLSFNLYNVHVYRKYGLTARAYWNNLRMGRIVASSASLFAILSVILKILGLSETVFEVTAKDQSDGNEGTDDDKANSGRFTFDESPIFLPGATILLVNLTALVIALFGLLASTTNGGKKESGAGLGEILSCLWIMLYFLPYLKGLFSRGKYGIPLSTICKATALALLFVHFSRRASMD